MATILFNKIYPKGSLVKNITVGSTEVKFVKRGDGILFYDILKSNVYNPPTITLNYSTNTSPAKGGTLSPSLSYSQSWYKLGYSGKTYSQTNITSGASSIIYSINGTGASINLSTGVVTWASRGTTTGEKRSATVTVTVTINGELNTATAIVYLDLNKVTSTATSYGNWSYNWTTTGNSTRTRTVTYTDTYSSGSTATRSGTNETQTGGTRYIVLDSFSDGVAEGGTHSFGAGGGTITARTVSHDYWPDTSGTHILTVVITGVSTSCTGFTCTTSGSTLTIKASSKGTTVSDANSATLVSSKSGFVTRSYGICKQAANTVSYSYGQPQLKGIKWSLLIPAGGGSATPSFSYIQIRTNTYSSGSVTTSNITSGASTTWVRALIVLNTDPEFYNGSNSIATYDNNGSGKTTVTRVTSGYPSGIPNNSGVAYKISNTGSGPSPNLGGFYHAYKGTSGVWYVWTFDAWIPAGYYLQHNHNTLGSGGTYSWTTPVLGVGEWRTYSLSLYFGSSNSSAFFASLVGTAGSSSAPVNWWIANSKICQTTGVSASSPTIDTSNGKVTLGSRGTTDGVAGVSNVYGAVRGNLTLNGKTCEFVAAPSQQANTHWVSSYGAWGSTTGYSAWADYDYPYSDTTGNYWVSVSIGSGLTAAGGAATITRSAGHTVYKWKRLRRSGTQYRNVNYAWTSGSTWTDTNASSQTVYEYLQVSNGSSTASDGVTLSISSQFLGTSSTATSGTNITRFSISGTTLSHSSMGANVGYDRVYVKAVNNGNTSVTNSANTYVQNVKDAWSQITAWGTPTISGVSYSKHSIYPSSTYGDACKPTVTASVTNTRTYYYTSNSVSRTVSETGSYVLSYAKTSSYAGVASVSDATVNATNGYVTFTQSGGGTDVQNNRVCWVIVTATNTSDSTKKTSASPCAAYLAVDSKISSWVYKSHSASYPALVPATGTDALRSIGLYLVVTHSYVTRWNFSGATISSTDTTKTYSTSSSDITLSDLSISGTGASINTTTGKVTWAVNGDALRSATISGKFKMNGITTSFSTTSTQAIGYTYKIRVKFINNVGTAVVAPFSCYSTSRNLSYTRISGSASLSTSGPSLLIPTGTLEGYLIMYTGSTISGTNLSIVFLRPYKNGTTQSASTLKIGSSSSATTTTYTRTFQKMSSSTAVPSTTNTIYIIT